MYTGAVVRYLFTFATAVTAVLSLGMALAALILKPRAALNRAVAVNGLLLGVWAIATGLFTLAQTEEQAWWFYRVASSASLLNPPAILWFFVTLSGESTVRRLFVTFPFWLVNGSLLGANAVWGLWYSGFEATPTGMRGIPDHPWAWAVFFVLMGVYGWAFFFFCSDQGFASARLAWLGRRFRSMVLVAMTVYTSTLVVELWFGWPDFSGLAFSLGAATWLYQIFRYGFLGTRPSLPALDLVLSLDQPLALVDPQGRILKANAGFAALVGTPVADCPGRALGSWFDRPDWESGLWAPLVASGAEGEWPGARVGRRVVDLRLTPQCDEFGDLVHVTVSAKESDRWERRAQEFGLSDRERQVALLLVQGRSTREIAEQTFISPATVRVHVSHLYEKTGARDRDELLKLWNDV